MINKSKKGFTLIETTIAIAVIVLISAGALTLVLFSNSSYDKSIAKFNLSTHASNIIECIDYAYDTKSVSTFMDQFNLALNYTYGNESSTEMQNDLSNHIVFFDKNYQFTNQENGVYGIVISINSESNKYWYYIKAYRIVDAKTLYELPNTVYLGETGGA